MAAAITAPVLQVDFYRSGMGGAGSLSQASPPAIDHQTIQSIHCAILSYAQ